MSLRCTALAGVVTLALLSAPGPVSAAVAKPKPPPPSGPIKLFAGFRSSGGCLITLPVSVTVPSRYAASYRRVMDLEVATRGPEVRNVTAELFTFGGFRIGTGRLSGSLGGRSGGTRALVVRMRYPAQAGRFTLVITGEPNANRSCGPKKLVGVIGLRTCTHQLPLDFPNPPGGDASGYAGTLSVAVRTQGPLLRHLQATLSSFDGTVYGKAMVPLLFGQTDLNFQLAKPLMAGGYSVFVEALSDVPRTCGTQTATGILTFTGPSPSAAAGP